MRGNASARIGNADPRRKEVRELRSRGEIVPPLRGSGDAGTPRKRRVPVGLFCFRECRSRARTDLFRRFARRGSERRRRGTIPRTPCASMGKIGQPKRKKSLGEAAQFFPFPQGREEMRQGGAKNKSENVLARTLFFFFRIADKEMRQGSAGCSRGGSFPKIT